MKSRIHDAPAQVPTFCALGSEGATINCWLGTAGTVTPLHYDSYDNLFAQEIRPRPRREHRRDRRQMAPEASPANSADLARTWAQVVGHKYVRLYDRGQSRYLYANGAARADADGAIPAGADAEAERSRLDAQGNMSAIRDLEGGDVVDRHPMLAHAVGVEGVVGPGDLLFVPARCWHYVRSLSTAWSVSFWF